MTEMLNTEPVIMSAVDPTVPLAPSPEQAIVKRDKTAGENAFDAVTYIGGAMGLNEVLSTFITKPATQEKALRDGWFDKKLGAAYDKLVAGLEKTPLNKIDYVKSGRLPYILFAFIGGTIAVLPVKWLEDHKGSLVRKFDRMIHGVKSETDPKLVEAHKEMDDAPKQTWGSLGQGRLITMGSAIAVDYLIGDTNSVSARLLDKTPVSNYSSMQRAVVTLSRKAMDLFDPKNKEVRALARDVAKPFSIQQGEGKAVGWLVNGSFLLTLSITLTALFYWSSKLFATRRELHKEEKREEAGLLPPNAGVFNADRAPALAANDDVQRSNDNAPVLAKNEVPATRIAQIAREGQVRSAAPMLEAQPL